MKHRFLIPLASAALIAPAFSQDTNFEQGVVIQASSLLPAELLKGSSHRVRDLVMTDGYMAHFEIDTDFGTFDAIGVPQAKRRIVEAEAIRKLVETSKGDLFAEGMKRSINAPIDAVKNIVKDPVGTAKQAPKTVGHFFSKIGRSIETGARRANERMKEAEANGTDTETVAKEAGQGIGNAAKNAAGFDKAKLDTAKQLGVDPYSDNARLQEEMDKVTWAFFAGGLPLRIGAAVVSAGVAVAATNMVGIPEDTYALTQSELNIRDTGALISMGVDDETIKAFQVNRFLSTTRRHRIATLLTALPKAKGRNDLVALAGACTTPEQADFLIAAIAILAEQQRSGAADYISLKVLGRLPGATTATGELQVPAPVDHVTWTEEVAGFAKRDDLGAEPKVLVHTGQMSPAASAGFAAVGWKLVAVPYPAK